MLLFSACTLRTLELNVIRIAKQQCESIVEVVVDNTTSDSKKVLIHRDHLYITLAGPNWQIQIKLIRIFSTHFVPTTLYYKT